MTFQPLGNLILVKMHVMPDKSLGGIHLPESARERSRQALVIATGPGLRKKDGTFVPTDVQLGDDVMLPQMGGTKVTLDGSDYMIFSESELLGIVTRE